MLPISTCVNDCIIATLRQQPSNRATEQPSNRATEQPSNAIVDGNTLVIKLDRIDKHILTLMQRNGRISNLELAEQVGLSPTPCSRRVKRLEESGIVDRHVTILNAEALNLNLTAFVSIAMDRHTPERFDNFEKKVSTFPEVLECSVCRLYPSDAADEEESVAIHHHHTITQNT